MNKSMTAASLDDIAELFEKMADDAARAAERATTKKMRDINNRESTTWTRAANVLRDTTLAPIAKALGADERAVA